jgi:hypothetical protein
MRYYWVFGRDATTGQGVDPFRVEAGDEGEARSRAAQRGITADSVVAVPVLRLIGYWARDEGPSKYPHPTCLVGLGGSPEERGRIAAYLRSGRHLSGQCGYSFCRFACGIPNEQMGSSELTDGEWVWPEGLAHYVEAHAVGLPEEFVAAIRSRRWQVPTEPGLLDPDLVDESFWLSWGTPFKG